MPYNRNNILKAFIFLIVLVLGAIGSYTSIKYRHTLAHPNSGGSQQAIMNAANGYVKNGFLSNMGLPDITYGDTDPNTPNPYVYTHYPPGMEWLAGLYTKVCGQGNYGCMRLFPTAISTFSLFLFALLLLSALNPLKALIIMTAVAIIPMTSNAMHVFQYHPYAFSLFLVQLGVLLNIIKKKKRINILQFVILVSLGFLQGWLSFDYFFLVSLAAVPFALLYSPFNQKEDKKRLFLAILAPCMGFGLAHFLHLIQVAFYYGSFKEAFNDLVGIGMARFNAGAEGYDVDMYGNNAKVLGVATIIDRVILISKYILIYPARSYAFLIFFPIVLGIAFMLIFIKEKIIVIQKPISIVLKWTFSRRHFYVLSAAFLISFLWIIVMYNHALFHPMFLVRHLFLLYFVCILTVIEGVSSENLSNKDTLNV